MVYDINGRQISTLINGYHESGYHSVIWDGTDNIGNTVSAGVYIYTLKSDKYAITRKMILMK